MPRLDLASLESGYHGLVKENETLVEVTPRIKAVGGDICSFRIVNKHHGEAPFEVSLKFVWQAGRCVFGLRFPFICVRSAGVVIIVVIRLWASWLRYHSLILSKGKRFSTT